MNKFPYDIVSVEKDNDRIKKDFQYFLEGVVRVGPEGYLLLGQYTKFAEKYYNFEVKESDVFVATFPRSGTTWTQEMAWLLVNNVDFEGAKLDLNERVPFLDMDVTVDFNALRLPAMKPYCNPERIPAVGDLFKLAVESKSPRCFKTHLPFSLLPPDLLEIAKVVYVARDPRDVIISVFHHHSLVRTYGFDGSLETLLEYFLNDEVIYGPFWSHIKQAWKLRDHPNMLFLKYEDMVRDLPSIIKKTSEFLGKELSQPQIDQLTEHLDFKSMKNNPAVNGSNLCKDGLFKDGSFIRAGTSGGWKNTLDGKMKQRIQIWIEKNSDGLHKELGWL